MSNIERERDEAILERDEMRRANITPEDAARPLGQSVEYWQDRALDHATHLDRARIQLREAVEDRDTLAAWLRWHLDSRNDLPPVTFGAMEAVVNRLLPPEGQ